MPEEKNRYIKGMLTDLAIVIVAILVFTSCNSGISNPIIIGPYLQDVGKSSITIIWECETECNGKVNYWKDGEVFESIISPSFVKTHKIRIENLEPETKYFYEIEIGKYKTKKYSFNTLVKNKSAFSFAIYGDNKDAPFNHKKIADMILDHTPLVVSNVGDIVDRGSVFKQWKKLFFTPAKELMGNIPLIVAMGNHEDQSELFYKYFDIQNKKAWFSYDIGNAHFVYLNSSESKYLSIDGEQYNWLIDDLKSKNKRWTFVFMHNPLVSAGGYFYDENRVTLMKTLHPIFEKYNVDVVFSGHNHHYERSKPIGSKNGNHIVTYIIAGNGGTKLGHIGAERKFSEVVKREHGFSIVEVDGSKLKLKEISINNKVIDEFEIDKGNKITPKKYFKRKIFLSEIETPQKKVMDGYRGIGRKLVKKKKYEEAIPYLQEAWSLDNTCGQAAGLLAYCFAKRNNYSKVIEYAMNSIKVAPSFSYGYLSMVEMYKAQNKKLDAIEWLNKLYKVQSDSPYALKEIAEIYISEGETDSAVFYYKKAVKVYPSDWKLRFSLATLYENSGQKKEALFEYKKAVEWFYSVEEDEKHLIAISKVEELSKLKLVEYN